MAEQQSTTANKTRTRSNARVSARGPLAYRLNALTSQLEVNTNPKDYITLSLPGRKKARNAVTIYPGHVKFLSHQLTNLKGDFEEARFQIMDPDSEEQFPENSIRVAGVEFADIDRHQDLFRKAVEQSRIFRETRR